MGQHVEVASVFVIVVIWTLENLAGSRRRLALARLIKEWVVQDLVLRVRKLARVPEAALTDEQVGLFGRLFNYAGGLLVLLVGVVAGQRQVREAA